MKKCIILALLAFSVIAGKAQFEEGTKYVGASVSNLGLSYNSCEKLRFGLEATAGYFMFDDIMLKADFGYNHQPHADNLTLGLGGRYYFEQNGIYLGTGLEYCHEAKSYNSLRIPAEVGYCFYVNHYVSIEPAVYYKMSLNDFSKKSTVGLKVGCGIYF